MADDPTSARPHRSRKRRPCDRCRSRKTACALVGSGPCRSCERAAVPCTFINATRTRNLGRRSADQGTAASIGGKPLPNGDTGPGTASASPQTLSFQPNVNPGAVSGSNHAWPFEAMDSAVAAQPQLDLGVQHFEIPMTQASPLEFVHGSPFNAGIQHVRSLEEMETSTLQLCGTSAELDPRLLRHCKFDDFGMRSHGKVMIRNVGGVPIGQKVPVHFTVVGDATAQRTASSPDFGASQDAYRRQLDELVPPERGLELISLYFRFVFPELPVISRTRSDLLTANAEDNLAGFPAILLAAIYATALPFSVHEPSLYIATEYDGTPIDKLWYMVYKMIHENANKPRLAVIQAALLFMHQPPATHARALNDSPITWSIWASIIGMSHSLGLHLQCRRWGIPAWEKRLRRRLWWALYVEDTWRSVLSGRPPLIHRDDWDVAPLDSTDFRHNLQARQHSRLSYVAAMDLGEQSVFSHLVRLTHLVADVHQNFYTLAASQTLANDFLGSANAAKEIRQKLQSWYSTLPPHFHLRHGGSAQRDREDSSTDRGTAVLQFCYLTAEVLLYRAMLRAMARSPPPAHLFGEDEPLLTDDPEWAQDFFTEFGIENLPQPEAPESEQASKATLNAAEKCGGIIARFTSSLDSGDFDALWYGWTRLGFAAVSNFMTLLVVQAPSASRASRAKYLWNLCLTSLQRQYKQNPALFTLSLVRLNSWPLPKLGDYFNLPVHVLRVITEGQSTSADQGRFEQPDRDMSQE